MNQAKQFLRKQWHTLLPLPVKYGRGFRHCYEMARRHKEISREAMSEFQWHCLKTLIEYAHEHVPFYRDRFAAAGLSPAAIQSREDFRRIPVLFKEDVAQYVETLKSDEFDRWEPIPTLTSATTRDGLLLYRSQHCEDWRKAVAWRHFNNVGFHFREPKVSLTVPIRRLKDPREMPHDLSENTLMIDPRAVRCENVPDIYRRIKEFRPKMISCQSSNLVALIQFCREHELPGFAVPIIYCLGEKIYPEYRRAIESFFGNNIIEYYGNRENTASAGECSDHKLYINEDACYLEFESDSGEMNSHQPANIISTSLHNFAFPLIRYHTEDVGINHGYPQEPLLPFRTTEILGGRGKDLLLTRRGLIAPQISQCVEGVNFTRFKRLQLEQKSMDEIILRVVPTVDFDRDRDIQILEQAFGNMLWSEFKISVELVASIAFTGSGKHKFVISELAIQHLRKSLLRE